MHVSETHIIIAYTIKHIMYITLRQAEKHLDVCGGEQLGCQREANKSRQ